MIARTKIRERGFAPLQAVLLLGAAFFVILALKELFANEARPLVEQATKDAYSGKTGGGSAASSGSTVSRTPAPEPPPRRKPLTAEQAALEAQKELKKLPIDLTQTLSLLAYAEPSDFADRVFYNAAMEYLKTTHTVDFIEDPWTGMRALRALPKDPSQHSAYLAIAGTNPLSLQDLLTDIGQITPDPFSAISYTSPFNLGALLGALRQYADRHYNFAAPALQEMIRTYGRENVLVTGHSLGGGVGTYLAMLMGVRMIGFNPAPLGEWNSKIIEKLGVPGHEKNITQIIAEPEFVHSTPGKILGNIITTEGRSEDSIFKPLNDHGLFNIDVHKPLSYVPFNEK